MTIGFRPAIHKGAITESSQERIEVSNTRLTKRKAVVEEPEEQDSMQVEMDDSINPIFHRYDQNGLPPGSIGSGKTLSVMAKVLNSSSSRLHPISRESSPASQKDLSSRDATVLDGLISTPIIDSDAQIENVSDDDTSSSEETSSSGTSSSEDESEPAQVSGDASTSSSSDSDGTSSDSSSDSDDAPEETSSKSRAAASMAPQKVHKSFTKDFTTKPKLDTVIPGTGKPSTHSRNIRRRNTNALQRYKNKGILPTGTTLSEFAKLKDVLNEDTPPEDVLTALASVRSAARSVEVDETAGRALAKAQEFEARRQALLSSLESGGVEVNQEFYTSVSKAPSIARDEGENSQAASAVATPPNNSSKSHSKHSGTLVTATTSSQEALISRSKTLEKEQQVDITPSGRISILPSQASDTPSSSLSKEDTNAPYVSVAKSILRTSSSAVNNVIRPTNGESAAHLPSTETDNHRNNASLQADGLSVTLSTAAAKEAAHERSPLETSITSGGSANDNNTPSRRSRLDLGAASRLLFGALGKRAPKTKKDEDNLRTGFMKDVRPVLNPKSADEIPEVVEEVAEEDPEAWRENINYRAVECCHDDVVLSEPPFPFEQRWDPQQRGGWSQKAKSGGKRKQDLRDQSQFYETQRSFKKQKQRKGKQNYADEYSDAPYEPSYEDYSMDLSYGDPTQDATILSDRLEGNIDTQLFDRLNEDASAGFNQGPEDLAPLPIDLSSLPDLQEGQAIPGVTIAFQQLVMSEETNWTPQFSAYRTAIVISILDNGDLRLSLALRDREQRQKRYDEETGRRIYGRFEMPEYSDDEEEDAMEDDGMLTLSFKSLLKAKIVQDAPAELVMLSAVDAASQSKHAPQKDNSIAFSYGNAEEFAEAPSHIIETQFDSETPELPKQTASESVQDLN